MLKTERFAWKELRKDPKVSLSTSFGAHPAHPLGQGRARRRLLKPHDEVDANPIRVHFMTSRAAPVKRTSSLVATRSPPRAREGRMGVRSPDFDDKRNGRVRRRATRPPARVLPGFFRRIESPRVFVSLPDVGGGALCRLASPHALSHHRDQVEKKARKRASRTQLHGSRRTRARRRSTACGARSFERQGFVMDAVEFCRKNGHDAKVGFKAGKDAGLGCVASPKIFASAITRLAPPPP